MTRRITISTAVTIASIVFAGCGSTPAVDPDQHSRGVAEKREEATTATATEVEASSNETPVAAAGGAVSAGEAKTGRLCKLAECGPAPEPTQCSDGTVLSPTCERTASGGCAWTEFQCPPEPCVKTDCGPAPGMPNYECDDGTIAGPSCQRDFQGQCLWTITECPDCSAAECGKSPFGMPNYECADGTIAGPVCQRDEQGACGWLIVDCQ